VKRVGTCLSLVWKGVSRVAKRWNRVPEWVEIFFGAKEELTDKLIDELSVRGWRVEDLRRWRSQGAMYCRARDSVMFPVGRILDD